MPLNGSIKPLMFIQVSITYDYVNMSHSSDSFWASGSLILPTSLNYYLANKERARKSPKDSNNISSSETSQ